MTVHRELALGAVGFTITLIVWEIVGHELGDMLLAPPSTVFPLLSSMLADGKVLRELGQTLGQMLIGFALACAIGMPLGALMGRSRIVDALVHPWIGMLVVTSVAALVPIYILVLGTGLTMRVGIVFTGSVGYVLLTAYHGARAIDTRIVDAARSFSTRGAALYRKVLLPALYPYLMTGARLGLVHAIRAMIMAEMFVITGYGGLIFQTGLDLSVAPLLAYLLLLMIVSTIASRILQAAGDATAPWYASRLAERR
jgi:ABC-type nitrate/sulfonate/bicarbonate transport system permease component